MPGPRGVGVWSQGGGCLILGWVSDCGGVSGPGVPGPGGLPCPGGVPGGDTPRMATVAGGTHPTGMHSCLPFDGRFSLSVCIINLCCTFSGVQWSSPFQLSKTVDNGSVIGTGLNHLVSTHHLETRMSVFKALHEQHIKYLPDEEKLVAR